jgi:hypothetical protein
MTATATAWPSALVAPMTPRRYVDAQHAPPRGFALTQTTNP